MSDAGQKAADALLARISAGGLAPGAKLNEVAVAHELGVSRNTLREAFSRLAAEGLLVRIPNRGVFVASPGPTEVIDVFRFRAALEPAALAWGPELDLAALRDCVDRGRAAVSAWRLDHEMALRADADDRVPAGGVDPRLAAVASANQDFHATVVAGLGSAQAAEAMRRVLALMRLVFRRVTADVPDFQVPFVDDNARIVALLEDGEREAAAAHLRGTLEDTATRLGELWDGTGPARG